MTDTPKDRSEAPMLPPLATITPIETGSNAPNAFISGLSYTASWGAGSELSPEQLEHIPVGIQEHAIADGAISISASSDNPQAELPLAENSGEGETEAYTIAKKIQKQQTKSAKEVAIAQQKKRVSKRLLLAERSKKLTVVCPITGIVSLVEVPAVPYPANNPQLAKALVWTSPFADIDNCRGIAQQGLSYLQRLDTQVLAGVLLVLASHYELFKFQPFDSGAQKNAILRTAGKDYLIDAIIMIEDRVHSNNCSYLPKLALSMDVNMAQYGLEVRMQAYLRQLADAIAKPDKDAWDDKKIKPAYPIRPVYVKDIKNAEKKVSFLARQAQARAKKEFVEDKKAGKIALSLLCKQAIVNDKLRGLLTGALSEDGMLVYPAMIIDKLVDVLSERFSDNANAKQLVTILRKDRSALSMSIEEIEENIQENLITEDAEADDAIPGQEEEIEDVEAEGIEPAIDAIDTLEAEEQMQAQERPEEVEESMEEKPLTPPAGLSLWEQKLWLRKIASSTRSSPRTFVQTDLPSTVTYAKADTAKEVHAIIGYSYSANRLYIIGDLTNNKRIYFVTDDYGTLLPVKEFSEWDSDRDYE